MCRRCRKPSARCRPSQKARLDKSKRAAGFRGHRLKLRRLFANVQVHELFLEQAKLTPTATALVLPHEAKTVVTYQESSCHLFGVRRCLRFLCGCPYRFSLQPFRSREPPAESAKKACLLGEELGEAVRQLASVLEQLGPLLAVIRGKSEKSEPCEARMARSSLYLCREAVRRWCRSSAPCWQVPATCPWTTQGQRREREKAG